MQLHIWNHLPRGDTKLTPIEIFTGEKFANHDHLKRMHVWGCPVFVLDPKLQDGKKIPKWNPRTRRGLFLGVSPEHSSSVGRILNLRTGHMSPQFHTVFDDRFTTVPGGGGDGFLIDGVIPAKQWHRLLEFGSERLVDDLEPHEIPPLHNDWLTEREIRARDQFRRERVPTLMAPDTVVDDAPVVHAPEGATRAPEGATRPPEGVPDEVDADHVNPPLEDPLTVNEDDDVDDLSLVDDQAVAPRRSS